MSKQQRVPGEDLLFSQSELAELDAELAPQAEESHMASAHTPPQKTPPSLDDLVESAFSDEATIEKQMPPTPDGDLIVGFEGFVEAEPASTGEIMAAMAEQRPISSAPALEDFDGASHRAMPQSSISGEISGSATTPVPAEQNLPSVIFDDSPFHEGEAAGHGEAAEIAPQLAALAAAIDSRQAGALPIAETVLSSSPPPSDDNLQVDVVTEGGGSLPNLRTPALVVLTHGVEPSDEAVPTAIEREATPPAPARPSGNTPVMSLDEHEFQLVEDSEERESAEDEAPAETSGTDEAAESEQPAESFEAAADHGEAGAFDEQLPSDDGEAPAEAAPLDSNIDAAWSEVAVDTGAVVASSTVEDLSPVDPDGESATATPEAEQPFNNRITPILGVPALKLDEEPAAEELAEPSSAAEETPLTQTFSEPAAEPAPVAHVESSTLSPAREAPPAPPILKDPLRRTSPGALPPPPPAPTKAPPPPPPAAAKAAQSPITPPPVPAPAAAPPPPPAARPAAQPAQAAAPAPAGGISFGEETKLRKKRRSKQWFEEIFDEDYLHTLPFMTPHQTEREVAFLLETLELPAGGRVLDIGCGYGRHAMEMAARGYRTVGLDLSLPLLIRATDAARRVGVNVDFVHGDMRDMTFDGEFDGAYCFFTTFGYFDDDTNRRVAAGICRALKPGGRFVLEMINRDYLIGDLPTRVWWQGDGCVLLEEVDFNYFTSRLQVQRQIILENGRQLEQEISIRAYSLHEIGKLLHHAGFRVLEVSGSLDLRGRFYGNESRQLVVVAERRANDT